MFAVVAEFSGFNLKPFRLIKKSEKWYLVIGFDNCMFDTLNWEAMLFRLQIKVMPCESMLRNISNIWKMARRYKIWERVGCDIPSKTFRLNINLDPLSGPQILIWIHRHASRDCNVVSDYRVPITGCCVRLILKE